MKRRSAIKRTAMMMGYALSASTVMGVMNGCKADTVTPEAGWKPAFFDAKEMDLVKLVTEQILPATDTPGANDVFVHRFMDQMIAEIYTPEMKERFRKGLAALTADCKTTYGKGFADCTDEQRDELLLKHEADARSTDAQRNEAYTAEKKEFTRMASEDFSTGVTYQRTNREPFFKLLKEMTIVGYFTSEKIGEEVLNYDPIPGMDIPCLDMSEMPNGRSWSL